MHLFAGRYGWTKEVVLTLPALEFFHYLAAIQKERRNEFNEQLRVAAFTGWQVKSVIASVFGAKVETFAEYTDHMGLLRPEEKANLEILKRIQKMQNKEQVKNNMEQAANIVQMDKAARKKKGG